MGKFFLAFLLLFIIASASCQDAVSFYFSEALPASAKTAKEFPAKWQATYLNEKDTLVKLVIEKDKIWVKHSILVVAKASDLLQKQGIKIENDLIFGLMPDEGVPYIQEKDTIYTAIFQKDIFFDIKRGDELKMQKNTWVLNYKDENGLYTVLVLEWKGSHFEICELDTDRHLDFLLGKLTTTKKSENGLTIYTATPDKKDFDALVKEEVFVVGAKYLRR